MDFVIVLDNQLSMGVWMDPSAACTLIVFLATTRVVVHQR